MFSRSNKRKSVKVAKTATVQVIKPEQENTVKPALDLSKAVVQVIEPYSGLRIMVEQEGEEDE